MYRFLALASAALLGAASTACVGSIQDEPGAGGAPFPSGPNCPDVTVRTQISRPVVQLVIDRSGSMGLAFEPGVDRWTAMANALVDPAAGIVTTLQDEMEIGASLYTSSAEATTCPVLQSVARGYGSADAVAELLRDNRPDGHTPTAEAIDAAIRDFEARPTGPGTQPVIVLATDGEPDTCANGTDDVRGRRNSVEAARRAAAAGIQLYILSVGTEISTSHLQQMANAGVGLDPTGGPLAKFFVATSQAQLSEKLREIIETVSSCDLDLDAALVPDAASYGQVDLDGQRLAYGADWEQVDRDTIRLLGSACSTLLTGNAEVRATFPCNTVEPE